VCDLQGCSLKTENENWSSKSQLCKLIYHTHIERETEIAAIKMMTIGYYFLTLKYVLH